MRNEQERLTTQQRHWSELRERGFTTPDCDAPKAFVDWWLGHDHCSRPLKNKEGIRGYSSGITAHKAWNLECYRLEFRERHNQHAAGTGLNYAYWGWHRDEPTPKRSNPELLEKHAEWCISRGRPDPRISQPIPQIIKFSSTFGDIKEVLSGLSEKMDMNKAIGWSKSDSEACHQSDDATTAST